MKSWKIIVPVVLVLGSIGGAIVHVRGQSAEAANVQAPAVGTAEVAKVSKNTMPVSDRYSGNVGVTN